MTLEPIEYLDWQPSQQGLHVESDMIHELMRIIASFISCEGRKPSFHTIHVRFARSIVSLYL